MRRKPVRSVLFQEYTLYTLRCYSSAGGAAVNNIRMGIKGVLIMRFILWVLEKFGWIGGIGFLAVILGIILLAAGGGGIGAAFLVPGIVVIVLAKKFNWP